MCDYSLAGLRTRLAVEGEELVVYRFPTGSIGLTSAFEVAAHKKEFRGWQHWFNPRETPCAVCIPPGARLCLRNIPEHLQRQLGVGTAETVVFTQVSAEAYQFRDAVGFRNGREVLLQLLNCRQKVEVLSLCSGESREKEHQRRVEEYRRILLGEVQALSMLATHLHKAVRADLQIIQDGYRYATRVWRPRFLTKP
jgi:hypothetical protein